MQDQAVNDEEFNFCSACTTKHTNDYGGDCAAEAHDKA
jgi:hypothetical protein